MRFHAALIASVALSAMLFGCGDSSNDEADHSDGAHTHADGTTHGEPAEQAAGADSGGHGHHAHGEEVDLAAATIGGMRVELAQGHGAVAAGKEGHLVVKLPYTDKGATVVRVWIGTEDRTQSLVGKGHYAPSHDDYDIHAMAPNPLPENAMWWIEIEKPDGTKAVGSAKPITE